MISFEQALAQVIALAPRLSTERVLLHNAVDRVLAESLISSVNLPEFTYSAMDGYALKSADVATNTPRELKITHEIAAGAQSALPVADGCCARIFTGAPIPPGADCVEMQENVTVRSDSTGVFAAFSKSVRVGQNLRMQAEDLAIGAVALPAQTRLRPEHLSLLTALGKVRVAVSRKPVVTILSTGDELREPEDPVRPGSVIECISPALSALAAQCGAHVRIATLVRDDQAKIEQALSQAMQESDLVLTIGGVSVGDHDLVRPALEKAGVTLDFWRVAIKPGKPVAFGHQGQHRWIGLPGNPASALLTFMLFGAPMLRAMQGDLHPTAPRVHARLNKTIKHGLGRLEFSRAILHESSAPPTVEILQGQASGSVVSLARANALALLPPDIESFAADSMIEVLRMRDV